jgi:hypothetical protein
MSKKLTTMEKAYRLIERTKEMCKNRESKYRLEEISLYSGYAEPGYDDPPSGCIALGNWNEISKWDEGKRQFVTVDATLPKLAKKLEAMGVELEWADEWISCDSCGKIFRAKPNSYGWQLSGVIEDGFCACKDCIDPKEHLENLENKHRKCNTIESINPEEHGYTCIQDDFENGLYGGQCADPQAIATILRDLGITRFLFNLDDTRQFDITFSVWLHNSELDKLETAKRAIADGNTNGVDPAEIMKNSLKNAPITPPNANGVVVNKIKEDGTVEQRIVSPQDFVDGKALEE